MEVWKDIVGYEGKYQVSNLGRVRTIDYIKESNGKSWICKGHFLKPNDAKKGYLQVTLYDKKAKRKTISIHRLVAKAFVPNPENLPEVNHIDENSFNNVASNLEWCTPKYNSNYGTRGKRISNANIGKGGFVVVQVDDEGNILNTFPSVCHAAKVMGVSCAPLQRCLKKNTTNPTHRIKGFIWKFKDN